MILWKMLIFLQLLAGKRAQDDSSTGKCNAPLGLTSDLEDSLISTKVESESNPSSGRLNNPDGAWCFSNESISSRTAVLIVDFSRQQFVSGFASQGPPEKVQQKNYNHVVGFSVAYSLDNDRWVEFNGGSLFFDADKNDTMGVISYHSYSNIELAQYVKINVTMQVSGSATICLRFEFYGCKTDFQPYAGMQALTTPKGKIEVIWNQPSAITTLESETTSGLFNPNGYIVRYRPLNAQTFETAATSDKTVSLEDVRLGAKYLIQLQCLVNGLTLSCGSTEIEAYPPCPEEWTGGNEYHCFLYLSGVSDFSEAKSTCLNSDVGDKLGKLSSFVDDDEKKFLVERILPTDVDQFWFIRDVCQESEECCKILKVEGGTVNEYECGEEVISNVVCLRDHKGEGAHLWVSSVASSDNGQSAKVGWRYEGIGWKTDKLQVKLWTQSISRTLTFSTLEVAFTIDELEPGVMYSLILKPAPNIRTEENVHKFIIIDFSEEPGRYGAFLTPLAMSVYVIWSGTLKITWEQAKAYAISGDVKSATKYSISHYIESSESLINEVVIEEDTKFLLTPLKMEDTYVFNLGCFFAESFQPCGSLSVKTDPPKHIIRQSSGSFVIYEVISDAEKNWFEAEEDCLKRSGHLTSILTDSEGKNLLQMLPDKNTKVWTGAKLGKKTTGYWTDGSKITYLPMAKNSGVTSDSESCCKALSESGKLRLTGGVCSTSLPYICKYLLKEIMASPNSLAVQSQTSNSFEITWEYPKEGWLPTYYDIAVCKKGSNLQCKKYFKGEEPLQFVAENLLEFTEHDVILEAVFKPVNVVTDATISAFTFPKMPVRYTVSTSGSLVVETPMLIALRREDSEVTASLLQDGGEVTSAMGNVNVVLLTGLVPEANYTLMVKESGTDWSYESEVYAVPQCLSPDVRIGGICCHYIEEAQEYGDAVSYCSDLELFETIYVRSLWTPNTLEEINTAIEVFILETKFWTDYKENRVFSDPSGDTKCDNEPDKLQCCSYDLTTKINECTYCCRKESVKQPFICSYEIAQLGNIIDLQPIFIGNTSFKLQWSPPTDVTWVIPKYESDLFLNEDKKTSIIDYRYTNAIKATYENLTFGTEYSVLITPKGLNNLRGESVKITVITLDPRPALTVKVQQNGVVVISSPLLKARGKDNQEVDVAVLEIDPITRDEKPVAIVRGKINNLELTGLELGAEYLAEMTPVNQSEKFNYSITFKAIPSCADNQIQDGFLCVWPKNETKTREEAARICEKENGELLDYKAQKELSPPSKTLLSSYMKQNFWVDVSKDSQSSALRDGSEGECKDTENFNVLCCSYALSTEGLMDDLSCTCCDEPQPFACKSETKVDLGSIGEINVDDVTATSLSLSWNMNSECNWQKPSYLVAWKPATSNSKRKKRAATENSIIIQDSQTTISNLESGTQYQITLAPYSDLTGTEGSTKDIVVSTRNEVMAAGFKEMSGCTLTILKIFCCVAVILGTGFTVFVFIATRMLYLDCLAQIFSELSLLGAYLCILISSSQSYSVDNDCMRASPTLCVAVSALIQFFFQAVFLFTLLECLLMCGVLKDFLPTAFSVSSPLSLLIVGFGVPAVLNIILAAIASNDYSDHNDNCWLNLQGKAMLPSIIPVAVFGAFSFFLFFSMFDADEPKENVTDIQFQRGKVFLKTRWTSFAILVFISVAYSTGMVGTNNRDSTLSYVFVGFSTAMAILIPLLRIRCDDQVKEQMKRGLFNCLRDDLGGIRVTPAPDVNDSSAFLKMSDLNSTKFKQKELANMKMKKSFTDSDIAWHH